VRKFLKKFWDITGDAAFTLAGCVVVYSTLSGDLKRIAGITTITAVTLHYLYIFWKDRDEA
jgi:hypothetical protein